MAAGRRRRESAGRRRNCFNLEGTDNCKVGSRRRGGWPRPRRDGSDHGTDSRETRCRQTVRRRERKRAMRGQQIKSHKGKHGAARGPPGSFHERAGLPILDFGSCDLRRPAWPLATKNNELLKALSLTSRRYCGLILQQKCEWK